jgi:hypothetical protein
MRAIDARQLCQSWEKKAHIGRQRTYLPARSLRVGRPLEQPSLDDGRAGEGMVKERTANSDRLLLLHADDAARNAETFAHYDAQRQDRRSWWRRLLCR